MKLKVFTVITASLIIGLASFFAYEHGRQLGYKQGQTAGYEQGKTVTTQSLPAEKEQYLVLQNNFNSLAGKFNDLTNNYNDLYTTVESYTKSLDAQTKRGLREKVQCTRWNEQSKQFEFMQCEPAN